VTPDYRLIGTNFLPHTFRRVRGKVEILQFGINGNLVPLQRRAITIPPNGDLYAVSLSPQGDRLLWTFGFRRPAPGTGRLIRRFPSLLRYFPLRDAVGIWISDIEGCGLHPIGEEAVRRPRSSHEPEIRPTGFRWMPDGKAIRFLYDNSLYELPL
jgi:hypothetical protein